MLMNLLWAEECSEPYSMDRYENTEFFDANIVVAVIVTIAATALIKCLLSCKIGFVPRIMDYKNWSRLTVIAY